MPGQSSSEMNGARQDRAAATYLSVELFIGDEAVVIGIEHVKAFKQLKMVSY